MGDFRDLKAWQAARELSVGVYRLTGLFPIEERFGLAAQLRRAIVSVSSNLAEGAGRSDPEFARFVEIARGSASELRSQLLLGRDLGLVAPTEWEACDRRADEISRMLAGLRSHLRRRMART
jgi:four helix bundle protein